MKNIQYKNDDREYNTYTECDCMMCLNETIRRIGTDGSAATEAGQRLARDREKLFEKGRVLMKNRVRLDRLCLSVSFNLS